MNYISRARVYICTPAFTTVLIKNKTKKNYNNTIR